MKLPQFSENGSKENEHNLGFAATSGCLPVTEDVFPTLLTWELLKMEIPDAL